VGHATRQQVPGYGILSHECFSGNTFLAVLSIYRPNDTQEKWYRFSSFKFRSLVRFGLSGFLSKRRLARSSYALVVFIAVCSLVFAERAVAPRLVRLVVAIPEVCRLAQASVHGVGHIAVRSEGVGQPTPLCSF